MAVLPTILPNSVPDVTICYGAFKRVVKMIFRLFCEVWDFCQVFITTLATSG